MNYILLIKLVSNINQRIEKELSQIKNMEVKETQHINKLVQILETTVSSNILDHFQLQEDRANKLKHAVFYIMNNLPALH